MRQAEWDDHPQKDQNGGVAFIDHGAPRMDPWVTRVSFNKHHNQQELLKILVH